MTGRSATHRPLTGAAAVLLWLLAVPVCSAQLPGEAQAAPPGPLSESNGIGADFTQGQDVGVDLSVPGLPTVKVNFRQANDPAQAADSGRLSLILTLPPQLQLRWNAREKLDLGVEHEYWRSRGLNEDVSESATRILLRLNF